MTKSHDETDKSFMTRDDHHDHHDEDVPPKVYYVTNEKDSVRLHGVELLKLLGCTITIDGHAAVLDHRHRQTNRSLVFVYEIADAREVEVSVTSNGPPVVYKFDYIKVEINSFNPGSGSEAGNEQVTIIGKYFDGDIRVDFGGNSAEVIYVSPDGDRIECLTPLGKSATEVSVSVYSSKYGKGTAAQKYTYTPVQPTTVSGILPNESFASGGGQAVIAGTNFGSPTTPVSVIFKDKPAQVLNHSPTQIILIIPPGIADEDPINVSVIPEGNSSRTTSFTYKQNPKPTIISVLPSTYPILIDNQVAIISGTNFGTKEAEVYFGVQKAKIIEHKDTFIRCIIPKGLVTGASPITVISEINGPSIPYSDFSYTSQFVPVIQSITPTKGSVSGGYNVAIIGIGFSEKMRVFFGEKEARVTDQSDGRIACSVPEGAGQVNVTVVSGFGVKSTPNDNSKFEYNSTEFFSISPPTGPWTGGRKVIISGKGFSKNVDVFFGSLKSEILSASDTRIECIAPKLDLSPNPVSQVQIIIFNNGLRAIGTRTFTYESTTLPEIIEINPKIGLNTGGYKTLITGSNFNGKIRVLFDNKEAIILNYSDAWIECIVPKSSVVNSVWVYVISETNGKGSLENAFTYTRPPTSLSKILAVGSVFVSAAAAMYEESQKEEQRQAQERYNRELEMYKRRVEERNKMIENYNNYTKNKKPVV